MRFKVCVKSYSFCFLLLLCLSSTTAIAQNKGAVIKVTIQNRENDSLYFYGKEFEKYLVPDSEGNFSYKGIQEPGIYYIRHSHQFSPVYIEPYFDLNIHVNAADFKNSISFDGNGSYQNNYLSKRILQTAKLWQDIRAVKADNFKLKALLEQRISNKVVINDDKISPLLKSYLDEEEDFLLQDLKNLSAGIALKGQKMPVLFSYKNLKNETVKLEDFNGKYVLIDIWATWCTPCIAEFPFLKTLQEKFSDKNFAVICISVDEPKDIEKWKRFKGKDLNAIQIIADNSFKSEFMKFYGIDSLPRYMIIGPGGELIEPNAPRPSDSGLTAQLENLLK